MSLIRQLRGIVIFAGLSVNTIVWFVPLLLLALPKFLLPMAPVRRFLSGLLMGIGENWITVNQWILYSVGSKYWVAELGDELRSDGWYLVIPNHQTWVDIVVLQTVFNRRIPFLKFFIKKELAWFPVLGIAWWALDMPFMKRYSTSYLAKHPEKKGRDLEATRKACRKFKDTPTSVINFVEGTRFTEAKRDRRKSPYRHLLIPRAGGVAVAIDSMGSYFDAVLDVTLMYPNGPPSFWAMCCGEYVEVRVHVRTREIDERLLGGNYAEDREHRRVVHRWLAELWTEKDAMLEEAASRLKKDEDSPTPPSLT